MKLLMVTARRPSRSGRGDQQRGWCWASELSKRHEVTVVCLGLSDDEPTPADAIPGIEVVVLEAAPWRRALAALVGLRRGVPLQTSWTRASIRPRSLETLAARHDAVLAVTSRVLVDPLPVPCVLDHIDAMSLNMRRRAAIDESRLRRLGARLEAALMGRHERRLAGWLGGQLVTTISDAQALPPQPPPVVMPPHTEMTEERSREALRAGGPRPIDVILTGNMHYPPNRAAFRFLTDELLPLLQAGRPGVAVRVVGRHATTLPAHAGVQIAADVPDMQAELRAAKVAIAPVEGGTGAPMKVIEAAAAGCAVVAPGWVMESFAMQLPAADGPAQAAGQILELLDDETLRLANAAQGAEALARSQPAELAALTEAELLRVVGDLPRS